MATPRWRPTYSWPMATWAAPPCRRAHPPASTKPWNCAMATSRATWAKARARRPRINGEIAAALHGKDATQQSEVDAAMIALDGTPNKGPPRRERDPGRLDGRRPRRRRVAAHAALPLPGRRRRAPAAGAHDEHPQRRRPRRQFRRPAGVHDRSLRRRRTFPKRCAWASRSSTR